MSKEDRRRFEQYQDSIARLYPELSAKNLNVDNPNGQLHGKDRILTRCVTFQVTDYCNLKCTYCYQINKKTRMMSEETARKYIDLLLTGDKGFKDYIDPSFSPAIILEFIGGEPFTNVELIDYACTYFMEKAIELHHPWAKNFQISICSNGTLYFKPEVQKFLRKWKHKLSFSVTIDGDKELHDSCRLFPDGTGSYDLAVAAAKDWMNGGNYMGSKITIAPGNIDYVANAIKHMISMGYEEINCNCVYEKGWTDEHATKLYYQLKEASDYLLDNNLEKDIYVSILDDIYFQPKNVDDTQSWCWGAGTPILTSEGYKPIEDIKIGDKVYTVHGSLEEVTNTMNHFANNCVTISASGCLPLTCTNNHKLFAKPFDYKGNKNKKHYKPYGSYEVSELNSTKDYIQLGILPNNRTMDIDKNVAYLIGRGIGDGWYSICPAICCGKSELSELKTAFDNANINYHITPTGTTFDFYIRKSNNKDSDNFNIFDHYMSLIGRGASNKHIPYECYSWNDESLQALINGYVSADGYINKKGNYSAGTSSYQLANDLLLILRTLGYNPKCDKPIPPRKEFIFGKLHDRKAFYRIYWSKNKHAGKFYLEENDKIFTSKLHKYPAEPQTVYNITVANDHTYIAGSFASHNCGGLGDMLSCDPDGYLYPCIRYMESSLGDDRPPVRIGSVDTGLCQGESEKCTLCELCGVNRRTYNTDECFYCPIAGGCADCAAYNYQDSGTFYHRATYICEMHKARALVNAYYFAKYYDKYNIDKTFILHVPEDWALKIIPQEELDMIKSLPKIDFQPMHWEDVKEKIDNEASIKENNNKENNSSSNNSD